MRTFFSRISSNDTVVDVLWAVFSCVLILGFLWLGIWIANGVVWLSSCLPDFGAGVQSLLSQSNWFFRALGYATLGMEWLYPCVFFGVCMFYPPMVSARNEWKFLLGILIFVIFVYDPRIAPLMPSFIEHFLNFFQTSCNAYLLTETPMGDINDGVYFTLFDIFMVVAYLLSCSFLKYQRKLR